MDLWKKRVVPKIHKLLGKDKRIAAANEASKSFDESKDVISKEFEGKKEELKPQVIEIYQASSTEVKALIKEPEITGLKKHSAKVQHFLDELAKIDFPGSKVVSEASSKYGPVLVPGPVTFLFEKVSTLVGVEEKVVESREIEIPAAAVTAAQEPPAAATTTAEAKAEAKEDVVAQKAAVVEEVKEKVAVVAPEKVETAAKETKVEPAAAKPVEEKKETPKA